VALAEGYRLLKAKEDKEKSVEVVEQASHHWRGAGGGG
jgi:hypothetical protein